MVAHANRSPVPDSGHLWTPPTDDQAEEDEEEEDAEEEDGCGGGRVLAPLPDAIKTRTWLQIIAPIGFGV